MSDQLQHRNTAPDGLEQLTKGGKSLTQVNFELAHKRSRCVARIVVNGTPSATGFLLPDNWLLTNHHVLPNEETAAAPKTFAQFDFQFDPESGQLQDVIQFPFDLSAGLPTSDLDDNGGDDWTLVKLTANDRGTANAQLGWIPIEEIPASNGDRAHIVQHPDGREKEYDSGVVIDCPDGRLIYDTETEGGSSGSPVFNSSWQLIGLHFSSGGTRRDPETGRNRLVNKGIAINRVIDGLKRHNLWPLETERPQIAEERGPMSAASDWYIDREADEELLEYYRNKGVSASIRGAGQIGKSSAANRVRAALAMDGWTTVDVNVETLVKTGGSQSGREFFLALSDTLIRELGASATPLRVYEGTESGAAFKEFVPQLESHSQARRLLVVLDRVDALAPTDACSEVVSILKAVVESQGERPENPWLHLLLLHTITPRQVGKHESIFGHCTEQVPLYDFDETDLVELVARYRLADVVRIPEFHTALGGHPFLCRRALNAMASGKLSMNDLTKFTVRTRQLFKRHLHSLGKIFNSEDADPDWIRAFTDLTQDRPLSGDKALTIYEQLLAIGVLKDTTWKTAEIRCDLYRECLPDFLP